MDNHNQKDIIVTAEMNFSLDSNSLYLLLRDFRNLPEIFDFINSVTLIDNNHSIWSTLLPYNKELIVYHIEITEEIPGKAIYWHSQSSTDLLLYASAVFVAITESSTQLRLSLHLFFPPLYDSPQLSSEPFQKQIEDDLRRFELALKAHEFPSATLSQDDLPDNLPHPNQPAQQFRAEHKKGDFHKRYNPPPKE